MTLPVLVTVKGTIKTAAGPQSGKFVFVRSTPLLPAAGDDNSYVIPEQVVAVVGVDGILNQPLYSGNDPAASPTGWTWEVRPHFPHWKTPFTIVVPYDAIDAQIDLNKIAPVPPDEDGQLYALVNHTHSGGGGGTGIDPSSTVVSEVTYGQAASAGNVAFYSRGNHTHGTPPAPNAAAISDSTVTGRALITAANSAAARTTLALGGAAILNVGATAGDVAAGDQAATLLAAHTAAADPHPQYLTLAEGNAAYDATGLAASLLAAHTAAADPHTQYQLESTLTETVQDLVGAMVVEGTGIDVVYDDAGGTLTIAATGGGGGGTTPATVQGYVTANNAAGNDVTHADTSGAWALMETSLQFSIAAAVGDHVYAELGCLFDQGVSLNNWFELVVVKAGAVVRYASTGNSTPAGSAEGDPAIYPVAGGRFRGSTPFIAFVAGSGDINAGTITFGVSYKGPGDGKVFVSSDRPFRYYARNDHQ